MKKYNHAIVITGSIASGKSSVCNILKLYGFSIIDADKISHDILLDNKDEIIKLFGLTILDENKSISREKLGNIVFNNKQELKKLESLIHPKIKIEILNQADKLETYQFPYFVDIPLYFESNNYPEFKKVALIYASKEIILQRLMQRNNLSQKEALNRINLQIDIEKKKKLANYIIDNSFDIKILNNNIINFIKVLKNEYPNIKI